MGDLRIEDSVFKSLYYPPINTRVFGASSSCTHQYLLRNALYSPTHHINYIGSIILVDVSCINCFKGTDFGGFVANSSAQDVHASMSFKVEWKIWSQIQMKKRACLLLSLKSTPYKSIIIIICLLSAYSI